MFDLTTFSGYIYEISTITIKLVLLDLFLQEVLLDIYPSTPFRCIWYPESGLFIFTWLYDKRSMLNLFPVGPQPAALLSYLYTTTFWLERFHRSGFWLQYQPSKYVARDENAYQTRTLTNP